MHVMLSLPFCVQVSSASVARSDRNKVQMWDGMLVCSGAQPGPCHPLMSVPAVVTSINQSASTAVYRVRGTKRGTTAALCPDVFD